MRRSLYIKFILGYIVFGLLGFITIAFFSSRLTYDFQISETSENLYNEASLMADTYSEFFNSYGDLENNNVASQIEIVAEYLDAYIEEIDEDLGMLEEDYYEDGGCDCDDEDCGCDDDFVEVECPECGETVCLDDSIDFDHVICPACGAEFSCVCDCCDDGDDNDECECGCGGKRGE